MQINTRAFKYVLWLREDFFASKCGLGGKGGGVINLKLPLSYNSFFKVWIKSKDWRKLKVFISTTTNMVTGLLQSFALLWQAADLDRVFLDTCKRNNIHSLFSIRLKQVSLKRVHEKWLRKSENGVFVPLRELCF